MTFFQNPNASSSEHDLEHVDQEEIPDSAVQLNRVELPSSSGLEYPPGVLPPTVLAAQDGDMISQPFLQQQLAFATPGHYPPQPNPNLGLWQHPPFQPEFTGPSGQQGSGQPGPSGLQGSGQPGPSGQPGQQEQPPAKKKQLPEPLQVYTVAWDEEKTLCLIVGVGNLSVARRCDNDMINGTKLLNASSMSRGRRDGILKAEVTRKVTKVGPAHLKGVWIPFERALEIAEREKVKDRLYPLFEKKIEKFLYHKNNKMRTQQVVRAAQRRDPEFEAWIDGIPKGGPPGFGGPCSKPGLANVSNQCCSSVNTSAATVETAEYGTHPVPVHWQAEPSSMQDNTAIQPAAVQDNTATVNPTDMHPVLVLRPDEPSPPSLNHNASHESASTEDELEEVMSSVEFQQIMEDVDKWWYTDFQ